MPVPKESSHDLVFAATALKLDDLYARATRLNDFFLVGLRRILGGWVTRPVPVVFPRVIEQHGAGIFRPLGPTRTSVKS